MDRSCRPHRSPRRRPSHYSVDAQTIDIRAERCIRTLPDEWAYLHLYPSNAERLAALPRYVDFYDRRRPHTAIRGLVPLAAVNNVLKHQS